MNNNSRWAMAVGFVLLAAVVGVLAYNAGVSQGVEQSGKIVAPPAGAYPYPYPYYPYRPWFGGFWIVPLFFIGFFLLFRGRHRHHHYACGPRGQEPAKEA
jgi:hypothetical protein